MTTPDGTDIFYGSIPVFRGFGSLMDPALYTRLPDDWTIGVADIVESTKAIAGDKDAAKDLSFLLLEQAQILDGELPEDPAAFASRLNQLVLRGIVKG